MQPATAPFAEMMARRAEERGVPPAPVETFVPTEEPRFQPRRSSGSLGEAEGQSFAIEYRDASGRLSRRRITVWSIKQSGDAVPVLQAMCHERKAFRPFRVDRILSCIDYDGEIFDDVPAFMAETFGMGPWKAQRLPPQARWNALRNRIRPHATLLSALSHCDGLMCETEIDAAMDHLCEIAQRGEADLDEEMATKARAYLVRLHPTRQTVMDAVEHLEGENPDDQRRFLVAAMALIDADGLRHDEEIALVNRFAEDLLGTPLL